MPTLQLAEITQANRPAQLPLLSKLSDILAASPAVTHLMVRGSLAQGTADRLSDVDFVVGVRDGQLPSFAETLDVLMSVEAGALLPGWRDTIVADLGGVGMVFLVPDEGRLHQIDLYLVPASRVPRLRETVSTAVILDRAPEPAPAQDIAVAESYVRAFLARPRTCAELLIEHLVLAVLLHKRIKRGQRFVAYAEWHRLHTATKDLIKAALAPASRFWGWYQLREEIAVTPIGRACLGDLDVAISGPAIPLAADVDTAVERVLGLVERACPQALDGLHDAVAAYRTYQELA
ncbi:nucleotidyltransferase domain-containing protein [Kitasatospora cineracea]